MARRATAAGRSPGGGVVSSSEQDKRLRAELAKELGFFPATLDPEDIARHRRLNAAVDKAPTREQLLRKWASTGGQAPGRGGG